MAADILAWPKVEASPWGQIPGRCSHLSGQLFDCQRMARSVAERKRTTKRSQDLSDVLVRHGWETRSSRSSLTKLCLSHARLKKAHLRIAQFSNLAARNLTGQFV